MNWQNGFAKFFDFAELFDRKVRKSGVRVVNDYTDDQFYLYTYMEIFIFLNFKYVNTSKYLFFPDCSFLICEKPSKFSKSVTYTFTLLNISCTYFVAVLSVAFKGGYFLLNGKLFSYHNAHL